MIEIIKHILIICFLPVFIHAQIPTDLNQNESYIHDINLDSDGEYLIHINLSSDTSWEEENNESAILTVFIDGTYNQDILIYNGNENHIYKQALGYLNTGEHSLQFYFDYNKSSSLASNIHINDITIINSNTLDIDEDVFKYSPILYSNLGIFLPLIAVNCSILGASIFMEQRAYNLSESVVFGFSSGVGFALAIITMAAIRFKLRYSNIPHGLRGLGITMILTGLISMAYLSFAGINL